MASILLGLSRSSSFQTSKETFADERHKWESVKTFIYLSYALTASNFNFDVFSQISKPVKVLDFIILELFIAMSYSFMDFFIKMFTGALDFNSTLNPMLRGVTFGMLVQTVLWACIYANELLESARYLVGSLYQMPTWTVCHKHAVNCTSVAEMLGRCRNGVQTKLVDLSAHHNFLVTIKGGGNDKTLEFVVFGFIWAGTFFASTVSSTTLIRIMKLSFVISIVSTLFAAMVVIFILSSFAIPALAEILSVKSSDSHKTTIDHLCSMYRIGFVGVYDFGTMSSYTLIDNAIILFAIILTLFALIRSLMFRMIYLAMKDCIQFPAKMRASYTTYVIFPVGVELLHAQKLLAIYVYLYSILTLSSNIVSVTSTIAKLLHSEFRKVKDIYIVGLFCLVAYIISVIISSFPRFSGTLKLSSLMSVLFLGALKALIVMYVYGVKRFSTDVEYWLGFKPALYWKLCWMCLPMSLTYFLATRLYTVYLAPFNAQLIVCTVWLAFTGATVLIFQIKTISTYMTHNNLVGAFKCSNRYGPPSEDERKNRKKFNETTHLRDCDHNCTMLDDRFDCSHEPEEDVAIETLLDVQDEESIQDIFEIESRRASSQMEVKTLGIDD